jgi:hypothetical protein
VREGEGDLEGERDIQSVREKAMGCWVDVTSVQIANNGLHEGGRMERMQRSSFKGAV